MRAHQIIDRLARLDEAPVEEPVVEPDVVPQEPGVEPGEPGPRHAPDPYELPPDFEPGGLPHPKAESEEVEAIRGWLEATQQPVQDWEWDGHELRMLMDDGTTEVYSRQQLDPLGIFDGEMAFAESEESDNLKGPTDMPFDDQSINDLADDGAPDEGFPPGGPADEHPGDEAAGVLDQILGRTPCGSAPVGDIAPEGEVIHIEGDQAEKLTNAVSDVVQAILGIVSGGEVSGEESDKPSDKASDKDKSEDKSKDKKSDKSKSDKDKDEDKSEDKKGAKDDDKEDDKKE